MLLSQNEESLPKEMERDNMSNYFISFVAVATAVPVLIAIVNLLNKH